MNKTKKRLTISLLFTFVISIGFVNKIYAYCFVNNSDIDSVRIIIFKNDQDLKNYLTTTGWTNKAATTVVAVGKFASKKMLQYTTGIDIGPIIDWLGEAYKYQMPLYWLGELTKKIELYRYSLKSHTIKKGEKACWAWAEIAQKIKDPKQKTLTFLVINAKNKEIPIIFVGELNFACELVLEDEGKLTILYPFIDSNGNIHLLTMPEGEAQGYVVPEGILPAHGQPPAEG